MQRANVQTRTVEGVERDYVVEIMSEARFQSLPASVQAAFSEVSDDAFPGALLIGGVWIAPPVPDPVPAPEPTPLPPPIISPVEFKLLFTSTERTAIKAARSDTSTPEATQIKAVLDDWYEILDDPRLKEVNLGLSSTIAGVNFLESVGLIDPGRATEILTGTIS